MLNPKQPSYDGGNPKTAEDGLAVIDVKNAISHPTELKVSQLGQTVRYVPLETGDSCFVGDNAQIRVCGKNLIATFGSSCLSFDRETGRFIARIGHVGDDPQGYSNTEFTYNDRDGLLYFMRQPNLLQKYDAQGGYHGSVTVPTPAPLNAMPSNYSLPGGHLSAVEARRPAAFQGAFQRHPLYGFCRG